MAKPRKKPKKPARTETKRGRGNPRGRAADPDEAKQMDLLGYATVSAAARAVKRAASSIYDRVKREAIPQVFADRKPVVKGPSGNVWVHLATLRQALAAPVADATGTAEAS